MRWVDALAMLIMNLSGFGIYNDEVIFGWLFVPRWSLLGNYAPDHLMWRFAGIRRA